MYTRLLFVNNYFLIRMSEKNASNVPARPPSGVAVGLTVTYGRPRLLGLPYVVEMCREILAVLCKKKQFTSRKGRDKYGDKTEGPRTESGGGVLVRGQQPPPHRLGAWESAVSSPSGVRGGALTAQRFSTIFSTQDGLS